MCGLCAEHRVNGWVRDGRGVGLLPPSIYIFPIYKILHRKFKKIMMVLRSSEFLFGFLFFHLFTWATN
jgi:hypothetical protein